MAHHFFEAVAETFAQTGRNIENRADFLASPSSMGYLASPGADPITLAMAPEHKAIGEAFRHQETEESETLIYQPILVSDDRDVLGTADAWAMFPAVHRIRLSGGALEFVDESPFELRPAVPTLDQYRDCLLFGGSPYIQGGLPGNPWGRCTDVGIGSGLSDLGGALFAILRVGNHLIPQFSAGNQCYSRNLVTGEYWRLLGFTGIPSRLRQVDPNIDLSEPDEEDQPIEFEGYEHTIYLYTVLGSIGGTRALILVEEQDRECSVISDFAKEYTPGTDPEFPDDTVRFSDLFRAKWVNATTTNSVLCAEEDRDLWYDGKAYNWQLDSLKCGGILGEPWGEGVKPLSAGSSTVPRTQGEVTEEFIAELTRDLSHICAKPAFGGLHRSTVTVQLQIWDFPADNTEPQFVNTLLEWNDESVEQEAVVRGASSFDISATNYGGLSLLDAPNFPDNKIINAVSDEFVKRSPASDFREGAGVMLHSLGPLAISGTDDERWYVSSEDVNNCPGPSGPWLDRAGVVTYATIPVILTRVEAPIAAHPRLPEPPRHNPYTYASDGLVAVFMPRYGASDIKCVPLAEGQPSWTIAVADYVGVGDSNDNLYRYRGVMEGNPVLTATFLYVVVTRIGGHALLKIRVRALLDPNDSAIVLEPAGTVTVHPLVTPAFGSEYYRDDIIVINRRLVAFNSTHFFELVFA